MEWESHTAKKEILELLLRDEIKRKVLRENVIKGFKL